jgi:bifunctional UDP-N-acetylglucosamine pyrophosphorylase/glucosamine-1-phosphate N-acetyltransferase
VIAPGTSVRGRTTIGEDCAIGPHTTLIDATLGDGVSVPHSYLVSARVDDFGTIGPFAYLRPDAHLQSGAKAGAFVEIKNSTIGKGTKVPHLSYIGDADVGEGTNIAAGAITANYRPELGPGKFRTTFGRNVHTASHNVFVAPVTVGDNAWIAAGSVVTKNVPPGALAIARSRQVNKEGFDDRNRHD